MWDAITGKTFRKNRIKNVATGAAFQNYDILREIGVLTGHDKLFAVSLLLATDSILEGVFTDKRTSVYDKIGRDADSASLEAAGAYIAWLLTLIPEEGLYERVDAVKKKRRRIPEDELFESLDAVRKQLFPKLPDNAEAAISRRIKLGDYGEGTKKLFSALGEAGRKFYADPLNWFMHERQVIFDECIGVPPARDLLEHLQRRTAVDASLIGGRHAFMRYLTELSPAMVH